MRKITTGTIIIDTTKPVSAFQPCQMFGNRGDYYDYKNKVHKIEVTSWNVNKATSMLWKLITDESNQVGPLVPVEFFFFATDQSHFFSTLHMRQHMRMQLEEICFTVEEFTAMLIYFGRNGKKAYLEPTGNEQAEDILNFIVQVSEDCLLHVGLNYYGPSGYWNLSAKEFDERELFFNTELHCFHPGDYRVFKKPAKKTVLDQ